MLEGLTDVLKILAEKVSRKAAVITIAIFLIYALGVSPSVNSMLLCVLTIGGLAILFTFLQAYIDNKNAEAKIKDNEEKEAKKKIKTEEKMTVVAPNISDTIAPNEEVKEELAEADEEIRT